MTIPTNTLLPKIIERELRQILQKCEATTFTINLSLDGVEAKHDEIRGVRGNFASFMDTFERLTDLKREFQNLIVGVHSVLSIYNLDSALEVYDFTKRLGADSYIMEVAEERAELFNQNSRVTPSPRSLAKVLDEVRERIKRDYLGKGSLLARFIQASRLAYYDAIPRILEKQTAADLSLLRWFCLLSDNAVRRRVAVLHSGLRQAHGESPRQQLRFQRDMALPESAGGSGVRQIRTMQLPPGKRQLHVHALHPNVYGEDLGGARGIIHVIRMDACSAAPPRPKMNT